MWPFTNPAAETRQVEQSHVWLVTGNEVRSLSDPEDWLKELFGVHQPDGIPTGSTAALRYPASAACIRIISSLIAEAPLHAYRIASDGSRERFRDHPAEVLLNSFANPWTDSPSFIRDMTVQALLNRDAFARVIRTRGEPRELHMLRQCTVEYDEATGEPRYKVPRRGGGQETLPYTDIIHLRSPTGDAPAKQAARAIELGLLIERAVTNLFKFGGRPSGLLSFKTRVDAATAKEIKDRWQEDIAGTKAGSVAVLGGEVTFTALDFSSVDNDTGEARKTQVLEVARAFGVSPTLLAELADASLNNAEALSRQTVQFTLAPWSSAWVGAVTRALVPADDRGTVYVEQEFGGLISADIKSRFEALRQAVGGPWMLPNEARALENQRAIDGGDTLNLPQGAPKPGGSNDS
jgi:HK97 family phage portal protein